jgi:mono/diheme cytochrome c family protein
MVRARLPQKMPSFEEQLSDVEIKAVAAYVRSLRSNW